MLLSPAAAADIEDIWNYTAGRWNALQAERYIRGIDEACRQLWAGTRTSRPVDIRAGYRKAAVGSHVLYFKTTPGGGIVVVRILHQSMDVARHL